MSTNKFILIPEEIYKGLMTTDTGNINLDSSRQELDKIKREKTDPATKNARYNQELRRYLHLKKENDKKPVKVELNEVASSSPPNIMTTTPAIGKPKAQSTPKTTKKAARISSSATLLQSTPRSSQNTPQAHSSSAFASAVTTPIAVPSSPEQSAQLLNELILRIKANPEKYNVTNDDRIMNENKKIIEGSNIKKSVNWILLNRKGAKIGPRPKGTLYIEERIQEDEMLNKMATPVSPDKKRKSDIFKPSLWH